MIRLSALGAAVLLALPVTTAAARTPAPSPAHTLTASFAPLVSFALCPGDAARICTNIRGSRGRIVLDGRALPGRVRITREVRAPVDATGPCRDVDTSGSLTTSAGTLTYQGTGVFCSVLQGTFVNYVVQITGGTGRFAGAHGSAVITTKPTGPDFLKTGTGGEQLAGRVQFTG